MLPVRPRGQGRSYKSGAGRADVAETPKDPRPGSSGPGRDPIPTRLSAPERTAMPS
ncbi:hypothetical protein XFF6166_70016 [Xanthomonas citri pv. fuscans]|nr:hypothetical protein XFF6166_70016 [Xanthomonas citri pv. fuscans]SON95596.1 hypothetical protein XFF7767_100005 [Xanthomonas citri pv. fuscans]SOO02068.1 hypothetical protein XFF6960_570029 [Xanthomonas citri pv. fuscans]SOO09501.1 hypothetical protein XFF6970_390023 [Xanthomonas citri pv. fuscans]SOO14776.1 hypothetical protein XFF7766_380017 [Xanthomonas citri pv. fuscans]